MWYSSEQLCDMKSLSDALDLYKGTLRKCKGADLVSRSKTAADTLSTCAAAQQMLGLTVDVTTLEDCLKLARSAKLASCIMRALLPQKDEAKTTDTRKKIVAEITELEKFYPPSEDHANWKSYLPKAVADDCTGFVENQTGKRRKA